MLTRGSFIAELDSALCGAIGQPKLPAVKRKSGATVEAEAVYPGRQDAPGRRIPAQRARPLRGDRRRDGGRVRAVRRDAGAAGRRQPRRAHPDPARRDGAVALRADPLDQGEARHDARAPHRPPPAVAARSRSIVALGFTMALVLRPPRRVAARASRSRRNERRLPGGAVEPAQARLRRDPPRLRRAVHRHASSPSARCAIRRPTSRPGSACASRRSAPARS